MKKKALVLLMVAVWVLPILAATMAGVTLPDSIEVNGQKLVLNGMALRKKVIFKVYVDGLYLPQKEKSADKIFKADTMRCNMMHFLRTVEAEKINQAWYEGLAANTPGHSAELKAQFDKLASWMEEMKSGDLQSFTYLPGQGTEVKVKGKIKGVIPGKAFADALFACWIGAKPGPGETFKNNLLGID